MWTLLLLAVPVVHTDYPGVSPDVWPTRGVGSVDAAFDGSDGVYQLDDGVLRSRVAHGYPRCIRKHPPPPDEDQTPPPRLGVIPWKHPLPLHDDGTPPPRSRVIPRKHPLPPDEDQIPPPRSRVIPRKHPPPPDNQRTPPPRSRMIPRKHPPPAPPETAEQPPPTRLTKANEALCMDPSVDAILEWGAGVMVFKGDHFYEVDEWGLVDAASPRLIRERWAQLPGHVDAAFRHEGSTYVLRGSLCWRYDGPDHALHQGFPATIEHVFPGVPAHVDAAIEWGSRANLYFFKGSNFWRFDAEASPPVSDAYPAPLATWAGVPESPEAAVVLRGRTYFFRGGAYYRFQDASLQVERANPPFPRPVGVWWFACPEESARSSHMTAKGNTTPTTTSPPTAAPTPTFPPTVAPTTTSPPTAPKTTSPPTGPKTTSPPTTAPIPTPSPTNPPPPPRDLCRNTRVDTVLWLDGLLHVFIGTYVWRVPRPPPPPSQPPPPPPPRIVHHLWEGPAAPVDAAFLYRNSTYLVRGRRCWRYRDRRLLPGYPRHLHRDFPGIPVRPLPQDGGRRSGVLRRQDGGNHEQDGVDAVLAWGDNGKVYFFKGTHFWKFVPWHSPPVSSMYPAPVARWPGLPHTVDAAFVVEGSSYFVKGSHYFRFDEDSFSVVRAEPPYPRSLHTWWFGCRNRKSREGNPTAHVTMGKNK